MNVKKLVLAQLVLLAACSRGIKHAPEIPAPVPEAARPAPVLNRIYLEGEVMKYKLTLDYEQTGQPPYSANSRASALVKKRADGVYYESWQWIGTDKAGRAVPLTREALDYRQLLSLDPGFKLAIQDLSKALQLVEPITDTLTFYADAQLAARKGLPLKAGEHLLVEHGAPNSWAGGAVLAGWDCIDFDLTYTAVDDSSGTATLKVLHVPPAKDCGAAPVPWLARPVAGGRNNWYQVRKEGGAYRAGAAVETFEDVLTLSLGDGRILSATQYNVLTGETRACADEALTNCGVPEKFTVTRRLKLSPDE